MPPLENISSEAGEWYKFIESLDEPFQFISILKAIKQAKLDSNFIVKNPILFDATCNGLQHLSALTRDLDSAIHVNLVSTCESIDATANQDPFDFYIIAGDNLNKHLHSLNDKKLKYIIVYRQLIKRAVMTLPYNVTIYGIAEQFEEELEMEYVEGYKKKMWVVSPTNTTNNQKLYLSKNDLLKLAKIVYENLSETFPLNKLKNYLNTFVEILSKLDKAVV